MRRGGGSAGTRGARATCAGADAGRGAGAARWCTSTSGRALWRLRSRCGLPERAAGALHALVWWLTRACADRRVPTAHIRPGCICHALSPSRRRPAAPPLRPWHASHSYRACGVWRACMCRIAQLFISDPEHTRYLVKYRHVDAKLVLKVTDDKVG